MGLPGHSPGRGKNGASGGGGGNAAIGNDKERATSESSAHDSGPSTSYVQQRRSTGSSRFKFLSGKRGRELSNLFHRHSTHHSSSQGHSATPQNHSRETSVQKENSSSFSPQPPPPSITKGSESEAAIESKRSSGVGGEDVGCSLESRFGTGTASSPNLRTNIRRMNLYQQAGPPTGTPLQGRQLPPSSSSTGFNTHAHHHLGIGGLHARRESFLYRADDRDSYYNPLFPSAAGRPISRASSVTSSDPQLVLQKSKC